MAIVDFGPYKDAVQVQNDPWKGLTLVQDALQDGASGIRTASVVIGTVTPTAVYAGGGTTAAPLTSDSTSDNFMDFRFRNTAASGDIRGMYIRTYYSGGGGGDCLRSYATVEASTDTVHGAHISLSFGISPATITGEGVAMRATFQVPNRAITLGTCAAIEAEVFMDGTSSAATATVLSLFRGVVDGGDATAQNKLTHVFDLSGLGTAVFTTKTSAAVSHWLKCLINGTPYYLMVSDQV